MMIVFHYFVFHTFFFYSFVLRICYYVTFPLPDTSCLFSAFVFICLARFINFIAVLKEFLLGSLFSLLFSIFYFIDIIWSLLFSFNYFWSLTCFSFCRFLKEKLRSMIGRYFFFEIHTFSNIKFPVHTASMASHNFYCVFILFYLKYIVISL